MVVDSDPCDFQLKIEKEIAQYIDEEHDRVMHCEIEPWIQEILDKVYLDMDSRICEVKNEMGYEIYKMGQELLELIELIEELEIKCQGKKRSFWKWWE